MKDNFVSPLCYGGCMCGQNGCSSCGSYAGLMEQTAELLQTLRSAMYPNMFGCNLGNGARLRNAVADCVMRVLPDNYQEISDNLVDMLPDIKAALETDAQAGYEGDPAAISVEEIMLAYPGFEAISIYRIAHELYKMKVPILPRLMTEIAHRNTGIDIHPGATIGRYFFIDHGTGVVIGETAEVGDDVTIYQGVTLGGTGKDVGKRHPTVGDGVMIGAGAKVLGPFKIGNNTNIAAGSVVLHEIPENSTAVGTPARVIKRDGIRIDNLDQINIPDPVQQEIDRLTKRIESLEEQIKNYQESRKGE